MSDKPTSSDSLLTPLNISEYQMRCKMALAYAKGGMEVTDEVAFLLEAKVMGYRATLEKVISILDDGSTK